MRQTERFGKRALPGGLLGLMLYVVLAVGTAHAQQQGARLPSGVQQADTLSTGVERTFAEGIEAFEAGNYVRAAARLTHVLEKAPAYTDPQRGASAYWLGRALAAQGQATEKRVAWRTGVQALERQGRFNVRLADAYLRTLSARRRRETSGEAAMLYRRLLGSLGGPMTPEEKTALVERVARLMPLLPDAVRQRVLAEGDRDAPPEEWTFREGAGEALLAWWRGQDPLPATRTNERLREHLARVLHAEQHYACKDDEECTTGLDDRGNIYLRYGAPDEKEEIDVLQDRRVADLVMTWGSVVGGSAFPDAEFWSYGRTIDRRSYYLFVEQGGVYRVATFEDMLPRDLRQGFFPTDRGTRRTQTAIHALRAAYEEISYLHPDLALRYEDLAMRTDGVEGGTSAPSYVFIQRMIAKHRNDDHQAARQREEHVPRQRSSVLREKETFPVAARAARFLDEDSTTRTEVYWAPLPGGLRLSEARRQQLRSAGYAASGPYVVQFTAVQEAAGYQERVIRQKNYRIVDLPSQEDASIPAQTVAVKGDTALYHLALQWSQHLTEGDGGNARLGSELKVGVRRFDSLRALSSNEQRLEMSDLKPMLLPEEAPQQRVAADLEERAQLYPFTSIAPGTSLALQFEVYHLALGANGRACYSVEYEVRRTDPDRGRLARLFRGDGEERTATKVTNESTRPRTQELIFLELGDWGDDVDRVEITVRVTDEVSGQTAERTIGFEVPG